MLKTGIHWVYNIAFWKSWSYYIRARKGYKRASQIKYLKASIRHWEYSIVMSKFLKDAISIITCSILNFWHLHVRYLIAFYHALKSYWKYYFQGWSTWLEAFIVNIIKISLKVCKDGVFWIALRCIHFIAISKTLGIWF